jgi:hypothetical protein
VIACGLFYGIPLGQATDDDSALSDELDAVIANAVSKAEGDPEQAIEAFREEHILSGYATIEEGDAGFFIVPRLNANSEALSPDEAMVFGVVLGTFDLEASAGPLEIAPAVAITDEITSTYAIVADRLLPKELQAFVATHGQGAPRVFALLMSDPDAA